MESTNETRTRISPDIIEWATKKYPHRTFNPARTATKSINEEVREMSVGDVVSFPAEKKYNTFRNTVTTAAVDVRMIDNAAEYRIRPDYDNKLFVILRVN